MDACDVAIVGGGPGGSSCAWALRNCGLDVVVLDRAVFPRNKLCAGWITPLILEELEFIPEDYPRDRVLQPITGFRISAIGGPQVEIRGETVVSYGIRRCEFDEWLLRRSKARMREGTAINSITRANGEWIINGELRARMLVGAGGHFCPVGRYLGNKGSPAPVLAQEVEFEIPPAQAEQSRVDGHMPELFFCRDMLGYGWVFRKDNWFNVGLGRTDSHEISRHVKDFVGYLGRTRGVETPANRIAGHAYGLWGKSQRKILDDGVLLVGDAAGLAYPESGEGIRPAIESGLMAAHTILSAEGNYSTRNLNLYRELLTRRLQRETTRSETLSQLLPHAVKEVAGRMLLRSHSFCQNVVVNQWFLRVAEQRLSFDTQPIQRELNLVR
jgi:flavin-dependent dehydrogenase